MAKVPWVDAELAPVTSSRLPEFELPQSLQSTFTTYNLQASSARCPVSVAGCLTCQTERHRLIDPCMGILSGETVFCVTLC